MSKEQNACETSRDSRNRAKGGRMTPKRCPGLSDEDDYVLGSEVVKFCVELGGKAGDVFILCFCVLLVVSAGDLGIC